MVKVGTQYLSRYAHSFIFRPKLPSLLSLWHCMTRYKSIAAKCSGANVNQPINFQSGHHQLKIAVEGCAHGELDNIYASLERLEQQQGIKVDLLIICGDFQAIRNAADMDNLAVPQKYRHMHDFHRYYSGERAAPYLTVFVGGNHESSAYLWELYHGGWVAPNIYFLGFGNVIQYRNLRIGGMSGIFNSTHYNKGHYEVAPYDQQTMRSIYHTRKFETFQMSLISEPMDVYVSHDWPRSIGLYGRVKKLYRRKPEIYHEIMNGSAGSPINEHLLHHLQPKYWFSAHMHKEFAAIVPHAARVDQSKLNQYDLERFTHLLPAPRDILAKSSTDFANSKKKQGSDMMDPPVMTTAAEIDQVLATGGSTTKFLALDKCLPGRRFLRIIDIEPDQTINSADDNRLRYDPEWLAIVRSTHSHLPLSQQHWVPPPVDEIKKLIAENKEWISTKLTDEQLCIPMNFDQVAPNQDAYQSTLMTQPNYRRIAASPYHNPQTSSFCAMLGIVDKINNSVVIQHSAGEVNLDSD